MRWAPMIAIVIVVLGTTGRAQDDADKRPRAHATMPRTAPVEALRAAVAERVVFDGLEVEIDPEADTIVVSRDGEEFETQYDGRRDPVLSRLRHLDTVLAETARVQALSDEDLVARFEAHLPVPPAERFSHGDSTESPWPSSWQRLA